MAIVIDTEKCRNCGLCTDICPEGAIDFLGIYQIDTSLCTACGLCQESCPAEAIHNNCSE